MNGEGEYVDTPLRPYVLTGGRACGPVDFAVDTVLVAAAGSGPLPVTVGRQERALLRLCRGLLTIAEAAAHLELPVSVVRVLAADLYASGHLDTVVTPSPSGPSLDVLKEVLDGLLAL